MLEIAAFSDGFSFLRSIAVAGFLVVKGKFAYLVIHGAVPIKDEGLRIIRKGFADFGLARRIGSFLRPVIVAKLDFLIFFKSSV